MDGRADFVIRFYNYVSVQEFGRLDFYGETDVFVIVVYRLEKVVWFVYLSAEDNVINVTSVRCWFNDFNNVIFEFC